MIFFLTAVGFMYHGDLIVRVAKMLSIFLDSRKADMFIFGYRLACW